MFTGKTAYAKTKVYLQPEDIYIRSLKMCISRLKIYIFKLEIELV